jgi:PIN domain nuclease of toxin-antitoxin system
MILLDTHVWVWWVNNDLRLSELMRRRLLAGEDSAWA